MVDLTQDIVDICEGDDGVQTPMTFIDSDGVETDPINVLWEDIDYEDGQLSNRKLLVHFPREGNISDYTTKKQVSLNSETYNIVECDDARSSNTVSLVLQLPDVDDFDNAVAG